MRHLFNCLARHSFVFLSIAACSTGVANAATLEVRLLYAPTDHGTYNVTIQAKTDTLLGIKGFEFDILSADYDGASRPISAGPPDKYVRTIWDPVVAQNFPVRFNPFLRDSPKNVMPPGFIPAFPNDLDSDLDALNGAFSDASNTFSKTDFGVGDFAAIASEEWLLPNYNLENSNPLNLYILGAQYYDFTNAPAPAYAIDFKPGEVVVNGVRWPGPDGNPNTTPPDTLPEPSAIAIALLALPMMAYVICRQRRLADDRLP